MGQFLSVINTIRLAIKTLLSMNKDLQDLLRRANSSPGLPVPNPTEPYWIQKALHPELLHRQSERFPTTADVVIFGSGITGAAIARSLLHESSRKAPSAPKDEQSKLSGPDLPRVVVLEARYLCSGATARNGGHIKSSPHELFDHLRRQKMSAERAAALVRFQLAHLDVLNELCEAEGWDVAECRKVETVDMYLKTEDRDKAFRLVREVQEAIPELYIKTWNAEEAQEEFKTNSYVKGAISYTAGALWPFRLVSSVWRDLLTNYSSRVLSLETDTPVTSVDLAAPGSSAFAYKVTTGRGVIQCNHVVHATNAFATQYIPGLKNKMTGALAHMTAQRPSRLFPSNSGERSWSLIYGSAFDYATQRPSEDGKPGDIMLGGGFSRSEGEGLSTVGVWDDSRLDALPIAHLGGIFPTIFEPNWGAESEGGGRMKAVWSGIISPTGDLRPFVGRLDPKLTGREHKMAEDKRGVKPGEWISAGYSGDGMVWAWLSGTAVGLMLAGSGTEDVPPSPGIPGGRLASWFPNELEPSLERVKKADLQNLLETLL
ncbi:FAD dependent oxidoreductase [Xylariaceae sp. FL0594]|nr:FAD dependent oxidoreductase [Xylariaceae sp. FL0594]